MNDSMKGLVWAQFFAALMSMNNHPGTTQGRATKRSVQDVAAEADEMLAEYLKRFGD